MGVTVAFEKDMGRALPEFPCGGRGHNAGVKREEVFSCGKDFRFSSCGSPGRP